MGNEYKPGKDLDRTPQMVLDDRRAAGGLTQEAYDLLVAARTSNRTVREVLGRLGEADITGAQMVQLWDQDGVLISYVTKQLERRHYDIRWIEDDVLVLSDYFLRQEVVEAGIATANEVYGCPWETTLPIEVLLNSKARPVDDEDAKQWEARLNRLRSTLDRLRQLRSGSVSTHMSGPSTPPRIPPQGRRYDPAEHAARAGNFDAYLVEASRKSDALRPARKTPSGNFEETLVNRDKKKT